MAVTVRLGGALLAVVGCTLSTTATAFVFKPVALQQNILPTLLQKYHDAVPLKKSPLPLPAAASGSKDFVNNGRHGGRDIFGGAGTRIVRSGLSLRATDGSASGDASRPGVDFVAIAKYIASTGAEVGTIMGILYLIQGNVLPRIPAKWTNSFVFFSFGFLALKSRTFSVLNARRPEVAEEKEAQSERLRPDWMPPPKVFPLIWISIGILRATSSMLVFEALGGKLVTTPIAAMVLHLSVGDTWNHINNVEKRLGVAVPVVFLVWLSVAHAAVRYYQALPMAGLLLLPSVAWIAVANFLVQAIWRLNGKEPLYPAKNT